MLTSQKSRSERLLQPVAHLLRGVNPNVLSLLGLIFPVVFFVLLVNDYKVWALAAFVFLAVDLLDGLVARANNKVSAFGGFLDSTIDRFADFTVIVAFGFAGLVGWNIILSLVLFAYLTSYIRSRTELAAKDKLTASVGIMERPERLLGIFLGLLIYTIWPTVTVYGYNLVSVVFIVLTVLSAITVAQRIAFAYKKLPH